MARSIHNLMHLDRLSFLLLGLGETVPILQFTDDTPLFIRASRRSAQQVKHFLDAYATEAGQHINFGKSTLVFSAGTDTSTIRELKAVLEIHSVDNSCPYLGQTVGKLRMDPSTGTRLRDRIRHRISHWWRNTLSLAGRRALLRAVLTAIPLYWLTSKILTKRESQPIVSAQSQFLWH